MDNDKFEPKDLLKLTLVSDPQVNPKDCTALYVNGRMELEKNKYIFTLWKVSPDNPPEPLTKGPSDTCPRWSPSGELIAFVSKREADSKGSELWILGKGEPWRALKAEAGIQSFEWAGDEEIVALAGYGKPDDTVHIINHLPVWVNGQGYIYFVKQKVLLLKLGSEPEILLEAGGDKWINDIAVSPDGKYLLYSLSSNELKPFLSELHIYDLMGRTDKILLKDWIIWEIGWTDRGNMAWFLGKDPDYALEKGISIAHTRLFTIDMSGETKCLTCDYPYNISNNVNSDARGPRCGKNVVWKNGTAYFHVAVKGRVFLGKMRQEDENPLLLHELGDGSIDGFSVGKECLYYIMMNHRNPPELYCYDPKTDTRKRLTWHNEGFIKQVWLGEHEYFPVQSDDGVTIDAWIMKPKNFDAKRKYPGILYIHGGPKTMFGEGFMMDFHILASQGYAVIYSNPRGSDGYTEDFADIKGAWGDKDFKDIMKVINTALEKFEWIDASRLGVTGGSYGGFMTNWIVTQTDSFKAAVTQRSCSDWISDFGTTDIGWYFTREAILGNYEGAFPWESPESYMKKSPLWNVNKSKTPLLIIHSLEDYRCHVGQAIELFTAYKLLGLETKLALFPGENHNLSRSGKPKARIERIRLILEWFKKYLNA